MKANKYLVIDCDGKNCRVTAKPPQVQPWEVCILLKFDIPDTYFHRPQFIANVDLPDDQMPLKAEFVAEDVRQAVMESTGLNVTVSMKTDDDDQT